MSAAITDDGSPVHEKVYRQLREAIAAGRFAPGVALTIRGIAESLGVSPMPAREAIRRLVAERALEMHENRRVSVPRMTRDKFDELVAARTLLEPEAAVRALPHCDAAVVRELERIDGEIDVALANGDGESYMLKNRAFHFTLYRAARSQVLVPLIESLWLQSGPFMRVVYGRIGTSYVIDQHKAAVAAIGRGDAEGLHAAIRADILDGMSIIGRVVLDGEEVAASARSAGQQA
jgi:DNA-binding GntR family transcriptional regulator